MIISRHAVGGDGAATPRSPPSARHGDRSSTPSSSRAPAPAPTTSAAHRPRPHPRPPTAARGDTRARTPTRSPTAAADTGPPSPTTHRTASSTTADATSRARSRRGRPPPRCATPCAGSTPIITIVIALCLSRRGEPRRALLMTTVRSPLTSHAADRTPAARLFVQQPDPKSAGTSRAEPPASRTLRASPSRQPDSQSGTVHRRSRLLCFDSGGNLELGNATCRRSGACCELGGRHDHAVVRHRQHADECRRRQVARLPHPAVVRPVAARGGSRGPGGRGCRDSAASCRRTTPARSLR